MCLFTDFHSKTEKNKFLISSRTPNPSYHHSALLQDPFRDGEPVTSYLSAQFYSLWAEDRVMIVGWLSNIHAAGGFLCQHNRSHPAADAS